MEESFYKVHISNYHNAHFISQFYQLHLNKSGEKGKTSYLLETYTEIY